MRRKVTRVWVAIGAAVAVIGAVVVVWNTWASDPTTPAYAVPDDKLWATQLDYTDKTGQPWSQQAFGALRSAGMNAAEINLGWNNVEPARGKFDFAVLDAELAHAHAAGMRVVVIFWQSQWGGNPADWIHSREVQTDGTPTTAPAWWDPQEQQDYFTYVTTTVTHLRSEAGYGGAFLDYGGLDAQWHHGGWAPADAAQFHGTWLPATYKTIDAFNASHGTTFASFDDVPAAKPGAPLAEVYQAFRIWSVRDTYRRLTAAVRKISGAPLYYYFGGHLANAPQLGNLPDIFFDLARTYHVTVMVDAAQSPGLTLTFGSLARAYGVPLAQEWTAPDGPKLAAQAVQWASNFGMGAPQAGGEDFFIHDGTAKDTVGFPIYTTALPQLKAIAGTYPQQPAAVYIDDAQAYGTSGAGSLAPVENAITTLWNRHQAGFAVVTSEEVANHVVDLSKFKAILPLNGIDDQLRQYQAASGVLLSNGDQIINYAPAYAELPNAGVVQTIPVTAADRRSATVTVADVDPSAHASGSVTFHFAGLNLLPGSYRLVDAVTGDPVAGQHAVDGGVAAPLTLHSAQLQQWNLIR